MQLSRSWARRSRAVGAGAAILLLITACGGKGAKTTTNTTLAPLATTSPSTATASTAPADTSTTSGAGLAAKASAAVLQPSDLPYGFTAQPPDPTGGLHIETIWHDISTCLGIDSAAPMALAQSPTFKKGVATQAVSAVEYTTPENADAIATAVASPKFITCASAAFAANAKRNGAAGTVPHPPVVTPTSVAQVGQKMSAFRISLTRDMGGGLQMGILQDFYVIVNGGTVVRMWFIQPGSPFPPDTEHMLVQTVVTRAG